MSAEIEKAINLVQRKYRVLPSNEEAKWIIELYKSSSKPLIKPYHIEHPTQQIYAYIVEHKLDVYAESKYDGTHIQFSQTGIFKHSSDKIAFDQLAHLLFLTVTETELINKIKRAVDEGFIIECELFGRDYTPRGFHKDYSKPLDLIIFEIGKGDFWITPPEKYKILEEFKLPIPYYEKVNYNSINDLMEKLSILALKPETFEGVVVKTKFVPNGHDIIQEYIKGGSLIVFKVKKEIQELTRKTQAEQEKKVETNIDQETFKILREEIENEIAKLTIEKGLDYVTDKRNIGEMINEITNRLQSAHPTLTMKVDTRSLKKLIANLIILNMTKSKK
jgi:hypothetical protein